MQYPADEFLKACQNKSPFLVAFEEITIYQGKKKVIENNN